jgi:peptide-methionine (S)-S-oxide reductase
MIRSFALALALAMALGATAVGAQPSAPETQRVAIFAGGCFWCVEADFDKVPGVISTTSGYTGGQEPNPTYEQVSSGATGHYEAVRIVYDPGKVSYPQLLDVFWRNIDPHDATGQFCDKGGQYRAAIFVQTDAERQLAEGSKAAVADRLKARVVTEVLQAGSFYPAEDYHQDYYRKNPLKYRFYRATCGRDARLGDVWGAATN